MKVVIGTIGALVIVPYTVLGLFVIFWFVTQIDTLISALFLSKVAVYIQVGVAYVGVVGLIASVHIFAQYVTSIGHKHNAV